MTLGEGVKRSVRQLSAIDLASIAWSLAILQWHDGILATLLRTSGFNSSIFSQQKHSSYASQLFSLSSKWEMIFGKVT